MDRMALLSMKQKIGMLVMPRIQTRVVPHAGALHDRLAYLVQELGISCFTPSAGGVLDTAQMCNSLQKMSSVPILFAGDFETGAGENIFGATRFPIAMAIGETGTPESAHTLGRVTARECRAVGVHGIFSPVVDVNNNRANPVIGPRAFGETVEQVVPMAIAYIQGVHAGGGLATAKHFPGHGDTVIDSHYALPTIQKSLDALLALELIPYEEAFRAGVDMVMTAHIAFPALDPTGLPATLSKPIITGLLRERLGFDGVVVTDALIMRGIINRMPADEATVASLIAGCDIALFPGDPGRAVQAIERALHDGRLSEARFNDAVRRVLRAKESVGLFDNAQVDLEPIPSVVRVDDDAVEAIAEKSLRFQGVEGLLPLTDTKNALAVWMLAGLPLANERPALRELMALGWAGRFLFAWEESGEVWPEAVLSAAQGAETVLLFAAPNRLLRWLKPVYVAALENTTKRLEEQGKTVIYLSLGDPFSVVCRRRIDGFCDGDASQRALARALLKR